MEQVKRKSTLNQLSKEEKKKLRNESNRSITCIENLSDELYYEIFDYLDSNEIYDGFSNLNHRFQQLLHSSSLLFKLKLHYSKSDQLCINNYQRFLLLNKYKILSIKLCLEFENNHFFSFFTIDSSLSRLESLFIQLKQSDILISLLINLSSLPRLFSLTIRSWYIPQNLNDIYRSIFILPTLKSFSFLLDTKKEPIQLTIATSKQLSPIEYLTIHHSCTFNELFTILSYTPQLRHLNLYNSIAIDTSIQTTLPITLPNLREIFIPMDAVKFDEFAILIRKINAQLKVLRVSTQSQDITFLNAHRWKRLILRSLSQLEEFYLRYYEQVDDEYKYPIYSGGPNQFTSAFWIKRQWTFEAEITGVSIIYFIRPYRKRWYEYTQDKIFNSSLECSKSTRLTITNIQPDDYDQSVKRDATRVLTITQIYHLEILEEKVHIRVLIEVVNLLSELDTLKIHSLSLYERRMLNSEELITLSSLEDTSQITKVYLQKMNEIEEFDFLLELCPYMAYLRVDCLKRMDLKFVLRYIFKKIKHHCNEHLRLLCFRIPTADDEMINKLKRMIHFEKLLFNYTVKRIADQIYIEWK